MKETACKSVQHSLELEFIRDIAVQANDAHVFLACCLLRFGETSRSFETHDEHACYFWVEGARVASLFDFEYLFDPGDDLMRAGVRWLIEVNDTILEILFDGSFERS